MAGSLDFIFEVKEPGKKKTEKKERKKTKTKQKQQQHQKESRKLKFTTGRVTRVEDFHAHAWTKTEHKINGSGESDVTCFSDFPQHQNRSLFYPTASLC